MVAGGVGLMIWWLQGWANDGSCRGGANDGSCRGGANDMVAAGVGLMISTLTL